MKCINQELLYKTYSNRYVLCNYNAYLAVYDCNNDKLSVSELRFNTDSLYCYSEKYSIITESLNCCNGTILKFYFLDKSVKYNELLLDKSLYMCFDINEDYLVCIYESEKIGFGILLLNYYSFEINDIFYSNEYLIDNIATCSQNKLCLTVSIPKTELLAIFEINIKTGQYKFHDLSKSMISYISSLVTINPKTDWCIGVTETRLLRKYKLCVFKIDSFDVIKQISLGFNSRIHVCNNTYIRWLDDDILVFETDKMYSIYDVVNNKFIESVSKKLGFVPTLTRISNNRKQIYGFK